jgi:uncharacterized protein (DUF2141 family)
MNYLLPLLLWINFFIPGPGEPGKIIIEINDIKPIKGNLYIAIYDRESRFMNMDSAYKWSIVPVTGKTMEVIFNDVAPGHYAIAVFHDKNMNGVMDKNELGIPKEGYGFSNNVVGIFGPPGFSEASFDFNGNLSLKIDLINSVFQNEKSGKK